LLRTLGVLMIIMAVVTVGQTAWYSTEQQKCNESFARNLAIRTEWNDQDREALNDLIVTVFENHEDWKQRAAYLEWKATSRRNELNRAQQDLPDIAQCD
jgi:hypothetical protein